MLFFEAADTPRAPELLIVRPVTAHTHPTGASNGYHRRHGARAAARPRHRQRARRAHRATRRAARPAAAPAPSPSSKIRSSSCRTTSRAIAKSLTRLGEDKVKEAQRYAKGEYKNLLHQGQSVASDVTDEFEAVEKQIKDTIRARPLTAMASAIGIGFLLAVLTR